MTITTPAGQVVRDEQGVRLEFVRDHEHPVEDVWRALTEPDRLGAWFGRWTGDPATGTVQLELTGEDAAPPEPVRVLTCEPPSRLVVLLPSPDGDWPLAVTLAPRDSGTRLVLVHRLAEPYDAASIGPGWHYYLDRLAAVLASAPVPDDFDDYLRGLQGAYALPAQGARGSAAPPCR